MGGVWMQGGRGGDAPRGLGSRCEAVVLDSSLSEPMCSMDI